MKYEASETNENQESLSRRTFLQKSAQTISVTTITATTMVQAISALGIAISTSACGSSSASPNTSPTGQNPVTPTAPQATTPRPEDWPADVGAGKQVIILGAGISGMCAAFEMARLGYSCTILEATGRSGGRVRTIRNGDQITETDSTQICQFDSDPTLYFNAGAARIPQHHDLLLGYCREFEVSLEAFINENQSSRFHSSTTNGGAPLLARQLVSDSQGYIGELLARAINQGALDGELSASDKTNLLGLLRQFADLDGNFIYQGSARAGFPGQQLAGSRERGNQLTPIASDEILESEFWQFKLDFFKQLNQQATMLQPIGGMDKIPQAFEQRVGSNIVFQAVVTQIRKTSSGVQVSYQDLAGTEIVVDADYCLCTIPAGVLKDIPNDFSTAHQTEIDNFSYSQAGKLAFQSNRFWETSHNIYGGISWTDQDITQIWYPSSGLGGAQGIMVGAYTFGVGQGERFAAQSTSERITSGISQANQIHSDFADQVFNGISISWPKVPFQLGGWGTSQPNVLLTEDENVFFAGEHLSILQGWQEGAILSAYSAIDLIVAKSL